MSCNAMECNICLESITNNVRKLKCGHGFHHHCINTWFERKNECPCCRRKVLINYTEKQLEQLWYSMKEDEFTEVVEDIFEIFECYGNIKYYGEFLLCELKSYQKKFWKIMKMCERFETDYEVSIFSLEHFDNSLYKIEKDDITDRKIMNYKWLDNRRLPNRTCINQQ